MRNLPRFLSQAVPGYEILDVKEWLQEGRIEIFLGDRSEDALGPPRCHRCAGELTGNRGKYRVRLEGMPILGLKTWRFRLSSG